MKNMDRNRRISLLSGILLILEIIVGVLSVVPAIESPNYLTEVSENQNQVLRGALFQLLPIPIYLGFAILLYPIVKKQSEGLAIGFIGFRIISQIFQLIGAILLPLFVLLSRDYVNAETGDPIFIHTIGELLRRERDLVNHVGVMLTVCLGNIFLYQIFHESELVPRWLSHFGFVGNILGILASISILFSLISVKSKEFVILTIPLVLQEIVLAFWLIVKGFDPSATIFGTIESKRRSHEPKL